MRDNQGLGDVRYKSYFKISEYEKEEWKIIVDRNCSGIQNNHGIIINTYSNYYKYIINGILVAERCGCNLKILELFSIHKVGPLDFKTKNLLVKKIAEEIAI